MVIYNKKLYYQQQPEIGYILNKNNLLHNALRNALLLMVVLHYNQN
jgi:hypothetical protein